MKYKLLLLLFFVKVAAAYSMGFGRDSITLFGFTADLPVLTIMSAILALGCLGFLFWTTKNFAFENPGYEILAAVTACAACLLCYRFIVGYNPGFGWWAILKWWAASVAVSIIISGSAFLVPMIGGGSQGECTRWDKAYPGNPDPQKFRITLLFMLVAASYLLYFTDTFGTGSDVRIDLVLSGATLIIAMRAAFVAVTIWTTKDLMTDWWENLNYITLFGSLLVACLFTIYAVSKHLAPVTEFGQWIWSFIITFVVSSVVVVVASKERKKINARYYSAAKSS